MKIYSMAKIFIAPVFVIMPICMFLIISGKANVSINGFAVDRKGYLYIGQESKIEVIKESQVIRTVSPHTSRGYTFTIENEKILVGESCYIYTMDLNGEILSKNEDPFTEKTNEIRSLKKVFIDEDGGKYKLINILGHYKVIRTKNGESITIYRMLLLDNIVLLLIQISSVIMAICIPIIVFKSIDWANFGQRTYHTKTDSNL